MNIRILGIALVICLSMLACSSMATQTPNEGQQEPDEAQTESQKAWDRVLTRCGETYVTNYDDAILSFCEYRAVKFVLKPNALGEAERLNNISWDGTSNFRAEAERCYVNGVWQDWRANSPLLYLHLTKRNGEWSAKGPLRVVGGTQADIKKVQCSDVPK